MVEYVGGAGSSPLEAVRALLGESRRVCAAVAYVRRTGVELLSQEIRSLQKQGGEMALLTTFEFGMTDPAALDRLAELGVAVRVYRSGGRTYHPKLYLGEAGEQRRVLLGSANLTGGALLRNVEAGIALSGADAISTYTAASQHFEDLWRSAAVIPYVPGTVLLQSARQGWYSPTVPNLVAAPSALAFAPAPGSFPAVWAAIGALCATKTWVQTANGQRNHLLQFDPDQGVLVGTDRSPQGELVPRWMFEVTVTWLEAHRRLRLNARKGSGIPDCTRYLRVHRSSAVFAILGALPNYRLLRRPAVLERL